MILLSPVIDFIIDFIIKYKVTFLFYSLVAFLVYANRKKFDTHGQFIYLYRTKIGIKLMNAVGNKARRFLKYAGYVGIFVGFCGMAVSFALFLNLTYKLMINAPGASGASPVIPGLPIAGTGLYFPLVTGWIAIFIIILVHEFSHGVIAQVHKIRIKSSGMAFFGPILGAFVEPDEKALSKEKDSVQHSVFAAGSFSNFILTAVVVFLLIPLFVPLANSLVFSEGVIVSPQPGLAAEKAGIANLTVITKINGKNITNTDSLEKLMEGIKPNEQVKLTSTNQTFVVTTTENPDNPSKGYLGIWLYGDKIHLRNETAANRIAYAIVGWIIALLAWVGFLSFNIGLINLLPFFITDGARMLKIAFERLIKDKKRSASLWLSINWFSVFMFLVLLFLPAIRQISDFISKWYL